MAHKRWAWNDIAVAIAGTRWQRNLVSEASEKVKSDATKTSYEVAMAAGWSTSVAPERPHCAIVNARALTWGACSPRPPHQVPA
eukprot:9488508-Pyramimonas_sp.AAC.1